MFTSMDIDEGLSVHEGVEALGPQDEKAFVEEMLRVYTRLHEQAEVQSLRGKLVWDGTSPRSGAEPGPELDIASGSSASGPNDSKWKLMAERTSSKASS